MRVAYVHPSAEDFNRLFSNSLHGSGLNDIRVYRHYSKGGSIFGVLGNLARSALPFLRGVILPEVGSFIKNITDDVSNNVPIRKSLKKNAKSSIGNLGKRVFSGKGKTSSNRINKNDKRKKKSKRNDWVILVRNVNLS